MNKKRITVEQAMAEMIELFDAREFDQREEGENFHADLALFIDKRKASREQVIGSLQQYFSDKVLPKGYGCRIEGITLLWTQVSIAPIHTTE